MNILSKIISNFEKDKVLFTRHARYEMIHEEYGRIYESEVEEAVLNGDIIENYPEDKPYSSILINGKTGKGRNIHVVCAYNPNDDLSIIITVYEPNSLLWLDYKKRKK